MTEFRRVALGTGVTLNVALAGDRSKPAVVLLHGFPESHRTWREIAPRLDRDFYLVMPDQRGFAGSDRPQEVEAYKSDILVDDIFALAEALGLERFALVGHDWGGAIAWTAALRGDPRLTRLAIVNAPHPVIFQKSLIEERGPARRFAIYHRLPRARGSRRSSRRRASTGSSSETFSGQVDVAMIPEAEKRQYIAEWSQPGALTAMLNWYRAAKSDRPAAGSDHAAARLASARLPEGRRCRRWWSGA